MEIHYKTTMWCKIVLDNDKIDREEVIQKLNEGQLPFELDFDSEWMVMEETEEFISPAENDGESTIELMEETEKGWLESIWDNSFESELKRKQNE